MARIGGLIYFAGMFVVTAAGNVPLNNELIELNQMRRNLLRDQVSQWLDSLEYHPGDCMYCHTDQLYHSRIATEVVTAAYLGRLASRAFRHTRDLGIPSGGFGKRFESSGPAAVNPPSTTRCSPVTNLESSSPKTAAPAMFTRRLRLAGRQNWFQSGFPAQQAV